MPFLPSVGIEWPCHASDADSNRRCNRTNDLCVVTAKVSSWVCLRLHPQTQTVLARAYRIPLAWDLDLMPDAWCVVPCCLVPRAWCLVLGACPCRPLHLFDLCVKCWRWFVPSGLPPTRTTEICTYRGFCDFGRCRRFCPMPEALADVQSQHHSLRARLRPCRPCAGQLPSWPPPAANKPLSQQKQHD